MDILIPLGFKTKNNWENNEIRICLRSIEQNLLDLDRIFIIGFKPSFIIDHPKLVYISFDDPFKANKDANIIRKVLKGISCGISENFIRISDDQLFLKPIYSKDIQPLYECDLKGYNWINLNRWRDRLKRTLERLISEGKTAYKYDSHIPVVYNSEKFKDIFSKYDWDKEREGYTINTLYFNNIDIERKQLTLDVKAVFERPIVEIKEINRRIEGSQYLGYNDKGLIEQLRQKLLELFPNKSSYED